MELKTDRQIFLAVITNKFLANSIKFMKICEGIEDANNTATLANDTKNIKPMYAIIKNGVNWQEFEKFSWRKVLFFDDEKSFDQAWAEMEEDGKQWKDITNMQ